MKKLFEELSPEIHEFLDDAIKNPNTGNPFPRPLTRFKTDICGDIDMALERHKLSIKMHILFSKFNDTSVQINSGRPIYNFAGILQILGRMPIQSDVMNVWIGDHYMTIITGTDAIYSDLTITIMPGTWNKQPKWKLLLGKLLSFFRIK